MAIYRPCVLPRERGKEGGRPFGPRRRCRPEGFIRHFMPRPSRRSGPPCASHPARRMTPRSNGSREPFGRHWVYPRRASPAEYVAELIQIDRRRRATVGVRRRRANGAPRRALRTWAGFLRLKPGGFGKPFVPRFAIHPIRRSMDGAARHVRRAGCREEGAAIFRHQAMNPLGGRDFEIRRTRL
jgi:hypothetical protein